MMTLDKFTMYAVTLRCRSEAEASKGDGVSHGHPSRLAEGGSRLRMTIQPLLPSSEFVAI
jgi:hypothetical protein